MSDLSPSKSFILPGINGSAHNLHNLSNKNLRENFASIGASSSSRTRDRAYSIDSSADSDGAPSVSLNGPRYAAAEVALSSRQLQHLFPYHISVDKDFNVVQMGEKLYPLVRCIISPNSNKKRINQHISKYFKIVSPASMINNWDAKMLSNLQVYSPSSAGQVDIELVSPRSTHGSSQRFGEDSLQQQAHRLLLRGRFHELCSFSSSMHVYSSSQAIHEDMEEDGSHSSDKVNNNCDYPGGVYLFLLNPVMSGEEMWSGTPFAHMSASFSGSEKHFVPSPISSPVVRRDSMDASAQEIARLMAANAALMAENERLKEENSGKDVRGMLGNVAHDLKTPLAAFMGGVELIKDMAKDCEDLLAKELHSRAESVPTENGAAKEDAKKTRSLLQELRKSLQDISQQATGARDINQFMTMTINRCIDYTKAAQGVKLVPRNETVNLTEVLAMPINCMIASQTNVQFRLHNPPVDICTHVITDKIWLQENMLCLLSNAAKYSNAGRVDIKISLFPTQCLAEAAERANSLLSASPTTGSHKNESQVPTENIMGPLSAKQVLVIHNQRQERAANASPAQSNNHRHSTGSSKDALSRKHRSGSMGANTSLSTSSRRATQAPVSSATSSSKVLSPVQPYRATIAGSADASAMAEAATRHSLGMMASQPISIPSYAGSPPRNHKTHLPPTATGAHAVSPVVEGKEEFFNSKLSGTSPRALSGRMESRPRASASTDPLLQTPKEIDEDYVPSSPTSHGSGSLTPKSTAAPLSPLSAHFNININNPAPNGAPRVAASPTNHHNHHHHGGLISTAIGNAMGLIKGTTGRLKSAAGGSSPSQSRNQSQSTSQSHSRVASRSQSLDVPDNTSQTSAGGGSLPGHSSQPLGKLRKVSKAEKMRSSVRAGEDGYDDTQQLQDDIEAMALRGSFSSDCEAEEGDRPSVYSEYSRSDSRQVSTDSRHSLRYSGRDSDLLLMKSFDEADEESAKTTLSQHHLLYNSTTAVAYSPSSYSYLASNNLLPATPVEVFPQSSGGLFTNKPIQKIQTNTTTTSNPSSTSRHATSPTHHHHTAAAAALTPLLLVEIEDTGIGLTESNMSKLFSPFMQAQRLAGGTGLGLYSLSKRLDALGGHYGVECRKDGQPGSLFWFAIPYREDADAASSNNNITNSPFGTFQRQGSSRLEDLILPAPLTSRSGGDNHHYPFNSTTSSSSKNNSNLTNNPNNNNIHNSTNNTNNHNHNNNKGSSHLEAVTEKEHSSTKSIADPEPAYESAPHSLHCSSKSSSSIRTSTGSVPAFNPATFMHNANNTTYQNQQNYHAYNNTNNNNLSVNVNAGQDSPNLSVTTAEGSPVASSVPVNPTSTTNNNNPNATRSMHFLLVDDSESILKITTMLLARAGHTVERAENGVIALDKIAASLRPGAKPFDVVLMDLLMPVLDGLEATKRLREIEAEHYHSHSINHHHHHTTTTTTLSGKSLKLALPEPPRRQIVVGMSANGDEETINDAYNAGVDRFIEKPFSLQKLLEALQEIHLDSLEDSAGGV